VRGVLHCPPASPPLLLPPARTRGYPEFVPSSNLVTFVIFFGSVRNSDPAYCWRSGLAYQGLPLSENVILHRGKASRRQRKPRLADDISGAATHVSREDALFVPTCSKVRITSSAGKLAWA
jgi:hypothetical protein